MCVRVYVCLVQPLPSPLPRRGELVLYRFLLVWPYFYCGADAEDSNRGPEDHGRGVGRVEGKMDGVTEGMGMVGKNGTWHLMYDCGN